MGAFRRSCNEEWDMYIIKIYQMSKDLNKESKYTV